MRRPGLWIALIAVLLLVNITWWVRQGGARIERSATPAAAIGVVAPSRVDTPPAHTATPATVEPPAVPPPDSTTVRAAPPAAVATPSDRLLLPVQGIELSDIHDTFNDARGSERRHEALDIMAPAGTPVLAVADGTIEKLFTSDAGGLTIYQFEPTGRFSYYYAHLQAYAPGLAQGARVHRGDVLGTVGSTGNADPAAPHLHFAIFRLTPAREWWTGEPVNPYPLLRGAYSPGERAP